MDERPVWKTVLGVVITLFFVTKTIYTCSHTNKTNTVNPVVNTFIESQDIQRNEQENSNRIKAILKIKSNNILYSSYESLDSLPYSEKEAYGVLKLKKDSLVYLDLSTQIKIPKDFYFQNNHDDSLQIAFKSPKNLNVFVHSFESKEDVETNFKRIKVYNNLQKFKVENTIGVTKTISYKISKNETKYNGYALSFTSKGFNVFIEFESQTLPKEKLKETALDFLLLNLKQKK
jgi:hypothetical protein